jgi:hypothetical protein
VKSLNVKAGGAAVVSAGVLKIGDNVTTTPLTLDPTVKLDLTSKAIVVDYPAATPPATALAGVRTLIVNGYSAGTWTGNGITSSAAALDPASKGIGYAQASDVAPGGLFQGTSVDGTAIIARYTLLGDATLDGAVNFADLVQLAQSYNVVDGTRVWYTGDFNYDGNTNFADLVSLAQNYNSALPTEAIPGASAVFAQDLARAFASVPEPGAIGLMAAGAVVGLMRRAGRRK